MARNSVAIRLSVEGGAETKRAFDEVGDAGERAAQRLGRQFEQQSAAAERAAQRAARTARTLAEMQAVTPTQARINEVTGVDRSVGNAGAARASAAAFMELEQRTNSLMASIDPLYSAQARLNAGMEEARALHAAGAISSGQLEQAQQRLQQQYLQTATAARAANDNNGLLRAGYQQLGFQISDVAAMLAAGASPAVVFGTQASQVVQALTMIGEGKQGGAAAGAEEALGGLNETIADASGNYETFKGAADQVTEAIGAQAGATDKAADASDKKKTKMERFSAFMGGPWGAALVGGIAILGTLAATMFDAEETVESLTEKLQEQERQAGMQRQAEEAFKLTVEGSTKALREQTAALEQQLTTGEQRRLQTIAQAQANLDAARTASQRAAAEAQAAAAERRQLLENPGMDPGSSVRTLVAIAEEAEAQRFALAAAVIGGLNEEIGRRNLLAAEMVDIEARVAERFDASKASGAGYERMLAAIRAQMMLGLGTIQDYYRNLTTLQFAWGAVSVGTGTIGETYDELERVAEEQRREAEQRAQQAAREAQQLEQRRRETIAGIERETRAAYALAAAYAAGEQGASLAEARQRAANDVRELGLDQAAHEARVFSLTVAEGIRDAARSLMEFDVEAANIDHILSEMGGPDGSWQRVEDAMERNRLLGPLLRLEWDAEGEDLANLRAAIERLSGAYDNVLARRRAMEAMAATSRLEAEGDDAAALAMIGGSETRDAAVARARIAADREISNRGWRGDAAAGYRNTATANAGERWDAEAGAFFGSQTQTRERALALMEVEATLIGRTRRERERELELVEMNWDLTAKFGPAYNDQIVRLNELVREEDARRAALERTYDAMAEFEQIGGGVIDEIFNIDNWDNWEEAGLRVLRNLAQEMLILAAVNPLKNMLLGGDRPEMGGILGALFGLGSAAAGGGGGASAGGRSGGFATGTLSYPGGWALMGENGPELARLPRGSQISTAAETRRIMGANDNRPSVVNNWRIDARGATPEAIDRLESMIGRIDRDLESRSLRAYVDMKERTYGRA